MIGIERIGGARKKEEGERGGREGIPEAEKGSRKKGKGKSKGGEVEEDPRRKEEAGCCQSQK